MTEEEYLHAAKVGYKYGTNIIKIKDLEGSQELVHVHLFVLFITTKFILQMREILLVFWFNKVNHFLFRLWTAEIHRNQ